MADLDAAREAHKHAARAAERAVTTTSTQVSPEVPEWVPPGHPHQWTPEEQTRYQDKVDDLDMTTYIDLDNHLFGSRECNDLTCCGPSTVREANSDMAPDWSPPELKTGDVFDPDKHMPAGDPDDWDGELWKLFNDWAEALPNDLWDKVQEEALRRMTYGGSTGDSWKPSADTGKTSWEQHAEAEQAEAFASASGPKFAGKPPVPDTTKQTGYLPPSTPVGGFEKKCMCSGPSWTWDLVETGGSGGFESHTTGCTWAGSEPCNCDGPGSANPKFGSHAVTCPLSKNYKPPGYGATGTTGSSYKPAPTCKHDRDGDLFKLEDGLTILPVSYRDVKYLESEQVDVGLYWYDRWSRNVMVTPGLSVPWAPPMLTQQVVVDWPDMGVPTDDALMLDIVKWTLSEAAKGVRFETACMGGHGRTGTYLAMLLVAQGITPGRAIVRVREHCDKCIETEKQAHYVAHFYKLVHGNEVWRKSKTERKLFNKAAQDGHKNYSSTYKAPAGYQASAATKTQQSGTVTVTRHQPQPYQGPGGVPHVWSAALKTPLPVASAVWNEAEFSWLRKSTTDTSKGGV